MVAIADRHEPQPIAGEAGRGSGPLWTAWRQTTEVASKARTRR